MTNPESDVIGGVDTHKHIHHAAVIDGNGRLLGAKEFTSDDRGQDEVCILPVIRRGARMGFSEGTRVERPRIEAMKKQGRVRG